MTAEPQQLRALPLQVIEAGGGIILKRGRVEIRISGSDAAEAVRALLGAASGDGATREEIRQLFEPAERPSIDALIDHLTRKRILVAGGAAAGHAADEGESHLSVFYWHFGDGEQDVARRLNEKRILVVGVNHISRQLAAGLRASAVNNFRVVDHAPLRNLRLFDGGGELLEGAWPAPSGEAPGPGVEMSQLDPESFDCLVAASDFGGTSALREWNEFCVRHRRVFLPVLLQDLIGYVGPFVVPGETACFECLRLRRNSHRADPDIRDAIEAAAFEGQAAVGFLPSMASILGDIAVVELIKFFGLGPPSWGVGTLTEVNLLASGTTARKVLKLPRCPVCSPLNERASHSVFKNVFQ